jgi:hypothetical protein
MSSGTMRAGWPRSSQSVPSWPPATCGCCTRRGCCVSGQGTGRGRGRAARTTRSRGSVGAASQPGRLPAAGSGPARRRGRSQRDAAGEGAVGGGADQVGEGSAGGGQGCGGGAGAAPRRRASSQRAAAPLRRPVGSRGGRRRPHRRRAAGQRPGTVGDTTTPGRGAQGRRTSPPRNGRRSRPRATPERTGRRTGPGVAARRRHDRNQEAQGVRRRGRTACRRDQPTQQSPFVPIPSGMRGRPPCAVRRAKIGATSGSWSPPTAEQYFQPNG